MIPRTLADACYHGLRLTGWLAVTAALVAALWPAFFALLGEGTLPGAVVQIDNFTHRYLAAAPEARAQFSVLFWTINLAAFAAFGGLRLPLLLGRSAPGSQPSKEIQDEPANLC